MADYAKFEFKGEQMLFWRLGGINSKKQHHYGKTDRHTPPTRRGIWAFPYPYHDYFFAWGQWTKMLPKKYRDERMFDWQNATEEECALYHAERDRLMKKIIRSKRPSTFWYSGDFYSHISWDSQIAYEEWFLWDSVKEWAKMVSKKHLYWQADKYHRFMYAKDHLEIFIPNY